MGPLVGCSDQLHGPQIAGPWGGNRRREPEMTDTPKETAMKHRMLLPVLFVLVVMARTPPNDEFYLLGRVPRAAAS